MNWPGLVLESLTLASLLVVATQVYLVLNKLWIRKHERAVAESVSIMGESLGLAPLAILSVNYAADGYWEGMVDSALWVLAGVVTIAVGTGRWVEGKRQRGFWQLVRESLRLERNEVGDLARSFFRPSGAAQILEILGQVALLDQELDERERAFVESFAESWGVSFQWEELEESGGGALDMVRLRRSVERYLATSPPAGQVTQLADAVSSLVRIDRVTTEEEELMLEELTGMFDDYAGEGGSTRYVVALVPQDEAQDEALRGLLPGIVKKRLEGGLAYPVGPYYSTRYADVVAEQYRSMSFFATVVREEAGDAVRAPARPDPRGLAGLVILGALLALSAWTPAPASAQFGAIESLARRVSDLGFYYTRGGIASTGGGLERDAFGMSSFGVELLFEVAEIPSAEARERQRAAEPRVLHVLKEIEVREHPDGTADTIRRYEVVQRTPGIRPDDILWTLEVGIGYGQVQGLELRDPSLDLNATIRTLPAVSLYLSYEPLGTYLGIRTGFLRTHAMQVVDADGAIYNGDAEAFMMGGLVGYAFAMDPTWLFIEAGYTARSFPSVKWSAPGALPAGVPRELDTSGWGITVGIQFPVQ
jgi:DnaJ-domain-containing protein 1